MWLLAIFALGSALGLAAAILTFLLEIFFWLKYGHMPDWDLSDFVGNPPQTSYLGINRIVDWYFHARLSAALFFSSVACLSICGWLFTSIEESRRGH